MSATKEAFYERYAQAAINQQIKYGIPASVTLAQMAIESACGTSSLSTQCNNYFGIKKGSSWTGPTQLFLDDHSHKEPFRVYGSVEESIEDHSKVLMYPVYQKNCKQLSSTDYEGWADGISKVYASNSSYATMLKKDIKHYGLDKYDRIAVQQAMQQGVQIGYMKGRDATASSDSNSMAKVQLAPVAGNWSLPIDFTNLRVSGVFGESRPNHRHGHEGLDISTKGQNLPVYATEDGGKIIAATSGAATGNMIKVEYERNGMRLRTTYMHLSQIDVKVGDTVNARQQIGVSGNTGRSTGPHLHFETQYMDKDGNWKKFDPALYLAEIEVRSNQSIPLMRNGQDLLAQPRSQMAVTVQQSSQDQNQALLANITNSNDPTKWLAYLMNNNGETSSGKDMFSELISSMFTAAITLAAKIQAEESISQTSQASEQKVQSQGQDTSLLKRARETVDAKSLQQTASLNFDSEYPEQQQSNGLRQA